MSSYDFSRTQGLKASRRLIEELSPPPLPSLSASSRFGTSPLYASIDQRRATFRIGARSFNADLSLRRADFHPPLFRDAISAVTFAPPSSLEEPLLVSSTRRYVLNDETLHTFACVTPPVIGVAPHVPFVAAAQLLGGATLSLSAKQTDLFDSSLTVLRPVSTRLQLYFPDKRLLQYDCGKLQQLDTLLRRLKAGGHRALIFTQMKKVLDILETFLNFHGLTYVRLDGATKIELRQRLVERFNADKRIFLFISSTRSGGLGLNLTGADTVIFYDSDWNPAMDKQAQDRCHR
jgi:SNF2 family DNA or RNA helicase